MKGLLLVGAATAAFAFSYLFADGVRLIWRALRRTMIARRLRDLLRCGAKADLAAVGEDVPGRHGEGAHTFAPVPSVARGPSPGRQSIAMPRHVDVFGRSLWAGLMPPNAHNAPWEDCHTFPKGGRPTRDMFGLHGDPPPWLAALLVADRNRGQGMAGGDPEAGGRSMSAKNRISRSKQQDTVYT